MKLRLFILLLSLLFLISCRDKYSKLDLSMYQYQDTKNLVRYVYDASLILKQKGLKKSIKYFEHNKKFSANKPYLYIYDMNGTNLYHAGMPYLVNKNLLNVTDKNGKKITKLVLNALADSNNPHSWVHYSWWKSGKFYPVPKSSCHFKVTTPEGKVLFIGAGLNYPHEEKEFIRIIVDDAVKLINEKGQEALGEISNPLSQYNYRDVRVFVFTADDKILISPVMNNKFSQIKLLESTDEIGHKPFATAIEGLKTKDKLWEVFMARNRYKRELIKKCLYVHKTKLEGIDVFVCAITDLPQPPS